MKTEYHYVRGLSFSEAHHRWRERHSPRKHASIVGTDATKTTSNMPSKVKQFNDLVDMAPKVPTLHWRLLTVVRLDRDGGRHRARVDVGPHAGRRREIVAKEAEAGESTDAGTSARARVVTMSLNESLSLWSFLLKN